MASNPNTAFELDASQCLALFKRLDEKEMKKVHRGALRKASKLIQKTAIKTLRDDIGGESVRAFDWWNNGVKSQYRKKKQEAIFAKVDKEATQTTVRIPYFMATKLFETGGYNRYTKKGYYRGDFEPNNFFAEALDESEGKAAEELVKYIEKGIEKQYKTKR